MPEIYKSTEGKSAVEERYVKLLKYWPGSSENLRIPTREGETFVVACGPAHAPPLVLLHGSAANSIIWMADAAAWAQEFRVYAVDLIGEPGLSEPSRPRFASEAFALWLDDVLAGLGATHASILGASLGGWIALDYATRRPDCVNALVLLGPAGLGRQKVAKVMLAMILKRFGAWGSRKAREMILGRAPENPSPAVQAFLSFLALIHENFLPRIEKLPRFSDAALERLTMPVLAVVGGKDSLLDSAGTRRRLERKVPSAEVQYLADAGHVIRGQSAAILAFLRRAHRMSEMELSKLKTQL